MSWEQLHERMDFMAALIERAAVDPEAALDFSDDQRCDIDRLFGNEEGLLLTLRQRWMTTLTAKLDQAAHDDIPPEQARAELAAALPGLRALLDSAGRRSVRMRAFDNGERRVIDLYEGPRRETVA
ncbi:hypothetical protein [Mycolicibacterium palauense]|uniref:hypothetical protein n=1 Tax=Mycolicibacterium palauense TaxID=2034511 RepID=UPI000BFF0F67|nr:hypothetical protein [Mycolicibacterium palauense]